MEGPYRVWTPNKSFGLGMSRSLGDFDLKKFGVSSKPGKLYLKKISINLSIVLKINLSFKQVMDYGK